VDLQVGNKAVQEAVAGRAHYGAQFSGVVSNATFTPSAKQLAASNAVLLLHFSELDGLADRLGLATDLDVTDELQRTTLKPES
jgi:restriction system protein